MHPNQSRRRLLKPRFHGNVALKRKSQSQRPLKKSSGLLARGVQNQKRNKKRSSLNRYPNQRKSPKKNPSQMMRDPNSNRTTSLATNQRNIRRKGRLRSRSPNIVMVLRSKRFQMICPMILYLRVTPPL